MRSRACPISRHFVPIQEIINAIFIVQLLLYAVECSTGQ